MRPDRALDAAETAAWIERAAFGNGRRPRRPRIGAEVELIPLDSRTRKPARLESDVLPVVRRHAAAAGWIEAASAKGATRFLARGGSLTFEPGGQLEYASPPFDSVTGLLAHLRRVVPPLVAAARGAGIDMIGAGIDPLNGPDAAPLQIESERYRSMDAYFATIGDAGRRMMRQTASIQVNIDAGPDPASCWRVLNAAAPLITAIFANSREYAGRDTGHASHRSHTWQHVDPGRTGIAWSARGPRGYVDFALDATAILVRSGSGEYLPFRECVERGTATPAAIETHMSTLFPEIRPRSYFEVRCIDALPALWYPAPILLLAGLALEPTATRAAADLLGEPEPGLLARAAKHGLRDPAIARSAADLVAIALAACRQPALACSPSDLETAEAFFEQFTRRGRAPADDAAAGAITVGAA